MALATVDAETRVCKTCKTERPIEAFPRRGKAYNGNHRLRECRDCRAALNDAKAAIWQQENADRGKQCHDCRQFKAFSDFNQFRFNSTGLYHVCRECHKARRLRCADSVVAGSLRICRGCGETKPIEDYPTAKHGPGGYHTRCRKCNNATRASNKRKARAARAKIAPPDQRHPPVSPDALQRRGEAIARAIQLGIRRRAATPLERRARRLLRRVEQRCVMLGCHFDLDVDWLVARLNNGCEALKVPFDFSKRRSPFSPSLDRKSPGGSYTKDNVQVVCLIYNMAKLTWSDDDVLHMARLLVRQHA